MRMTPDEIMCFLCSVNTGNMLHCVSVFTDLYLDIMFTNKGNIARIYHISGQKLLVNKLVIFQGKNY